MTLSRVVRLTDVKSQRSDRRLADLLRCKQNLADARNRLAEAQAEVERFQRDRQSTMFEAYAAIRGEELSETDLRNLNQKLDKLAEQENGLIADLGKYRQEIVIREDEVKQAATQFSTARRNRDKWNSMIKPMKTNARRQAERLAEIERDDLSGSRHRLIKR